MNRLAALALLISAGTLSPLPAFAVEGDSDVVKPVDASAATGAVEAVPISKAGPSTILARESPFQAQYSGVVKVETAALEPNYGRPWLSGNFTGGRGTAFLIGKNLFLTNAHVVSNAQQLYISKYGDSRKLKAHVVNIAHDCDLALLKVDDFSSFKDMKPFKLGKLPRLEDEVRVIGYPVGGDRLSVTRGVVSRIDTLNYSHSIADKHLVVQIDAAINPGNSGGPVLMGGDVVGVAFQGLTNADNTGYMIPIPVIEHFLKDVEDGKYDNYVSMGVLEFPILNPAMRVELGLPDDEKGVLVGEIYKTGPAEGILKPGDVILKLDGKDVDSSGMMKLDDETLNMNELVERKFAGDKVKVDFLRDKKPMSAEITLAPVKSRDIIAAQYDKQPCYVVFGGLLFQPANRNTITAHRINNVELNQALQDFVLGADSGDKEDIVLLTAILPDEVNERLEDVSGAIVAKVNGVEVKGLKHLYELLHPKDTPEFFVIEVKGDSRPIVLDGKQIEAANKRIAERYDVTRDARLED